MCRQGMREIGQIVLTLACFDMRLLIIQMTCKKLASLCFEFALVFLFVAVYF
jgi:hypothetical protein